MKEIIKEHGGAMFTAAVVCQYWKAATKISPFLFEIAESGHCTASYCKKQIRRKTDRRHVLK